MNPEDLKNTVKAELKTFLREELQKIFNELKSHNDREIAKLRAEMSGIARAELKKIIPDIEKAVTVANESDRELIVKKFDDELVKFAKSADKRLSEISNFIKVSNIDGTQIVTDYRDRVMTGRDRSDNLTTYLDAQVQPKTPQIQDRNRPLSITARPAEISPKLIRGMTAFD